MLASLKVAVQGKLTRNNNAGLSGLCRINAAVFGATAIIMAALFLRSAPTAGVLTAALLYGIFGVLFQLFYMMAFATGSIGATAAINNFGVVFSIIAGIFVYNEPISAFKIVGIVLMVIPFVLLPKRDGGGFGGGKWLLFSVIAVLSSGASNLLMLICSHNGFSVENSRQVVIFGYAAACLISLAIMNLLPGSKIKCNAFGDRLFLLKTAGVAVPLGLYNVLLSSGLHYIPGSVLIPVVSVLSMSAILLIDLILFRQKLTVRQYIGLGMAVLCVVLLNIG